mmetsp:Transcript_55064/g.126458  ORF Transcript_55064/g.126458 Transcript_55064/m.126458 type:complete len:252 (+) Transcript_55064:1502-2257(+)
MFCSAMARRAASSDRRITRISDASTDSSVRLLSAIAALRRKLATSSARSSAGVAPEVIESREVCRATVRRCTSCSSAARDACTASIAAFSPVASSTNMRASLRASTNSPARWSARSCNANAGSSGMITVPADDRLPCLLCAGPDTPVPVRFRSAGANVPGAAPFSTAAVPGAPGARGCSGRWSGDSSRPNSDCSRAANASESKASRLSSSASCGALLRVRGRTGDTKAGEAATLLGRLLGVASIAAAVLRC